MALREAGLPSNKRTLVSWEKKGYLVSPRSHTNSKIINGNRFYVRQFTSEQIEQIVKAFFPGGPGKWPPSL